MTFDISKLVEGARLTAADGTVWVVENLTLTNDEIENGPVDPDFFWIEVVAESDIDDMQASSQDMVYDEFQVFCQEQGIKQ